MSGGASRSRLLELARLLEAAERGREVLARKRELVLFELRRRHDPLLAQRRRAATALSLARAALTDARIELGGDCLDGAVLSQPATRSVEVRLTTLLGVAVPRLSALPAPFRPAYGTGGTSARLDDAGGAFVTAYGELVVLAELEAAVHALRRGLARTARRESALERRLIPRLRADLSDIRAGIEEEERDEAVRRRAYARSARVDGLAGPARR
jgi:V/A-type H+-transporting ATPase subunit D